MVKKALDLFLLDSFFLMNLITIHSAFPSIK